MVAVQQGRHYKRAIDGVGVDNIEAIGAAVNNICLLRKFTHSVANLVALTLIRKRAHIDVFACGVPDSNLSERRRKCIDKIRGEFRRRNDAPDGGALLASLAGHLTRDFLTNTVELRRSGDASGPRIDEFSESVSAVNATDSLTTFGCCCRNSAVDFEPVKAIVS